MGASCMAEFLQQIINGLVLGSIYALIAVGLSQIFGVIRIIQWAHGEVYMIGAYLGFFLTVYWGFSYFMALIVTTGLMALFGVLMERVVFRPLRGLSRMSTTLGAIGLSVFLLNAANIFFSPEPQRFSLDYVNEVLQFGPITITYQRAIVFFVSLILIVSLSLFIKRTVIGKSMIAMSEDMEAASLMGIDVNFSAGLAFAIGSALAGAAGVLIAPIFLLYPTMSGIAVIKAFPVVVLGGLGSVEGAIWSGYILGLTESLMSGYLSSAYKDLPAFVILILVLYFRPQGLMGRKIVEKV